MAKTKVLRVVARREGFRRVGRVFGAVACDIPVDSLAAAERAAIQGDPGLVAIEIEVEDEVFEPAEVQAAVTAPIDPAEDAGAQPAVSASGRKRK